MGKGKAELIHGESGAGFRRRLEGHDPGLWREYVREREDLVREGATRKSAERRLRRVGLFALPNWEKLSRSWDCGVEEMTESEAAEVLECGTGRDVVGLEGASGSNPSVWKGILWCVEHIDSKGVRVGDAPSRFAWGLLQDLRANKGFRLDFWKTVLPRMLPSKGEIDRKQELEDDGREIFSVLSRVEAELRGGDAEGDEG